VRGYTKAKWSWARNISNSLKAYWKERKLTEQRGPIRKPSKRKRRKYWRGERSVYLRATRRGRVRTFAAVRVRVRGKTEKEVRAKLNAKTTKKELAKFFKSVKFPHLKNYTVVKEAAKEVREIDAKEFDGLTDEGTLVFAKKGGWGKSYSVSIGARR